ncbi:ABC transporter ATP-binding protein [Parasphaerochaeta coccoides]|uniref:Xenobiotic-transporting ATPase n=1 Tax=Parasphaerochaeta coccoides (strain ATCC BAA-1237 / DSM 17374 / SPN1) TaxID=760011 RepID=F4GJY4_PARC1|nr:ABC transporter ATP-binding protein [Parasphaerochaeta coccoides]AEC01409.1 Xenobiotic-transporting ATPase [Parasphaerochaeta coccoides DSM 17374]
MTSIFRRIFQILKDKRLMFAAVIVFSLVSVLGILVSPQMIGKAIDGLKSRGNVDFPLLFRMAGILAIFYAAGMVGQWISVYLDNRLSCEASHRLRKMLFSKLQRVPIRFHDTASHGDVATRFINDAEAVSDGMLQGMNALIQGIITIAGTIVFMLSINLLMAGVIILSSPLAYLVARFITVRSQKLFRETARYVGVINGYAEEMITGQLEVLAFNHGQQARETFAKMNQELKKVGTRSQFISAMANPSTRIVNNTTYAVVGIIGGLAALTGNLSVGELSSFLLYAVIFSKPFNEITSVMAQIQAAAASAERIFSILDAPEEVPDDPHPVRLDDCTGEISFEHVSFAYEHERKLIQDFDMQVKPGSRIALVGRTGAGKTTMVNLLMRFYDVDHGAILLDGTDIRRLTRSGLRRHFGMVLQDTWVFDGTIHENIAYARPEASRDDVIRAAMEADADSFIRRLPHGYDTPLATDDSGLSQGQVQLLTIARVMLADPPMLILDEATSNIDTFTEKKIQEAFQRMMKGRTTFVIAHRLSTIRNADEILVMEKGSIVEKGTHAALMEKKGAYYALYTSQFSSGA